MNGRLTSLIISDFSLLPVTADETTTLNAVIGGVAVVCTLWPRAGNESHPVALVSIHPPCSNGFLSCLGDAF